MHAGYRIADLKDSFSDEIMGHACDILGRYHFTIGSNVGNGGFVAEGCIFLELALLYGNIQSATRLVNIHNDPVSAELLATSELLTDTKRAMDVITSLVNNDPDHVHPNVMLTYLSDEFNPRKLGQRPPSRLAWAFSRLDRLEQLDESSTPPILHILDQVPVYDRYQNPSKIKLQIVDHCLQQKISLPDHPLHEMGELRDALLQRLARYNDPVASMIIVTQPNGPEPYTKEWERYLMAAAGGGDGHALWLIGIHQMRQEGLYPVTSDTKDRIEKSLGFEYARLSIMALDDQTGSMIAYTLGLAALCRAAGDSSRGFLILAESMNEALDNPNFPEDHYKKLDGYIRDWDISDPKHTNFWGKKKCETLLGAYFDPQSDEMKAILSIYRRK